MQQQVIDLISKFNNVFIDTTKELMNINSRSFELLSEKQANLVNDYIRVSLKQLEAAQAIKDPKEIPGYISKQTTELQKCAEKFNTSTKETWDVWSETTEELNAWMKKGMDTAAANLKSVSGKKAA